MLGARWQQWSVRYPFINLWFNERRACKINWISQLKLVIDGWWRYHNIRGEERRWKISVTDYCTWMQNIFFVMESAKLSIKIEFFEGMWEILFNYEFLGKKFDFESFHRNHEVWVLSKQGYKKTLYGSHRLFRLHSVSNSQMWWEIRYQSWITELNLPISFNDRLAN